MNIVITLQNDTLEIDMILRFEQAVQNTVQPKVYL